MWIEFAKYHALGNDFIVPAQRSRRPGRSKVPAFARAICDRRSGVGADGIVWLSSSRKADAGLDIYNSDGSWAEKSGNGLRIAAVHMAEEEPRRKRFELETATSVDTVRLVKKIPGGFLVRAELGRPDFIAKNVPVKTRQRFLINSPLKIGTVKLPVTCLAVGNPHTVIPVSDFDFDWQALGTEIEVSAAFPNGTNVEFVQLVNRKKIRVADWERGAGATGSSGTGAAAAVCAFVMMGMIERQCEVVFETGSLHIDWRTDTDVIELTGPVQRVMQGRFDFRS